MKIFKNKQWQSIVQIFVAVMLLRFLLFRHHAEGLVLTDIYFLGYFLSTVIVAFAGLYLYRIVRQEENPHRVIFKNIDRAYYQYLGLNMVAIAVSFMVSNAIEKTVYFGYTLALAAILYLYITQWRKVLLLDNIVFAFVVTFPIFLEIFTDLPTSQDSEEHFFANEPVLWFSLSLGIFLWILFFIQTILQDLQFMQYDIRRNKKTLATLHGREKGAKRTTFLSLIPLTLLVIFIVVNLSEYSYAPYYLLIAAALPILYFLYILWNAKDAKDFNFSSNILSIIIWLSIFSIVILSLDLNG